LCFRKNRIIETSDDSWLFKALKSYKKGVQFQLSDDVPLSIEKSDVESGLSLIKKTQALNVSWSRVAELTKKIGLCSTSLAIIGYSITDEEPSTKLEELLSKDSMLISPKSLHALQCLSRKFKVIKVGNEFKIAPYH